MPGVQIASGNHQNPGPMCVGNCDDRDLMRRFMDGRDGKYLYLPKEGLIFPELLEPEPVPKRPLPAPSYGELIEAGEQALFVNDWQATMIGSYVYKLLHCQLITTFLTFANADDLVIQSKSINRQELEAYLGTA